ncbi:hypothetical protein FAM09_10785 [Niastella caeni]|uniref:Uncharacterized protein n=1 Tax=Niastella caeni TaxID=2569763 RepID=A0A4S8HXX1_9BACT|nr:hypothetical protein [Niastella caeni]THU40345.1 hypothetical protein FAM09_10785 [Niastella caeni]
MRLINGITINNQLQEGYDSVKINSGTVFHTEQLAEMVHFQNLHFRPQYEEEAYVVKRDWRSLTPAEIKQLQPKDECNSYNTVYLGELPEHLKNSFRELDLAGSKSRDEVFEKFYRDAGKVKAVSNEMHAFLSPFSDNKPFYFNCIGTQLPNLEMVACETTKLPKGYHPKDVQYMGIHNDGRTKMTVHTAHKFGNRISINLGKEARGFLFVNLSMIQALNMLKKKIDIRAHNINISNISSYFFRHFPDYPVLRIQQKPYQYYIAPTDNCFHDGSTLGNSELDITLIYFGFFKR